MSDNLPIQVDSATRALLERYGFDAPTWSTWADRLGRGEAGSEHNRVSGTVTIPTAGDVVGLPALGTDSRSHLREIGQRAIREGRVGAIVLAGGMATRFGGVVKAAVEVAEGRSFLDLKLSDVRRAATEAGGRIPVYLMTSFATDDDVKALGRAESSDAVPVETFAQFISLRLTEAGDIFRGADGKASPYAPGHGGLTFALRRAGILRRFRELGGSVLLMSNVDNLTATLDPAVIGSHLDSEAAMTAEVAPKEAGDKGGAPARVDGKPQIVESFRFPEDFDQESIPVFNTNTFVLDAAAIDKDFELSHFAVRKTVDDRPAVQFERLVGQLTAVLPSRMLRVERHGPDARFQPVKDPEELRLRLPEIIQVLRDRGIL